MNWADNNCDGAGPHSGTVVKTYPVGGSGASILCLLCWKRENRYAIERAHEKGQDPANWPHEDWNKAIPYAQEVSP